MAMLPPRLFMQALPCTRGYFPKSSLNQGLIGASRLRKIFYEVQTLVLAGGPKHVPCRPIPNLVVFWLVSATCMLNLFRSCCRSCIYSVRPYVLNENTLLAMFHIVKSQLYFVG